MCGAGDAAGDPRIDADQPHLAVAVCHIGPALLAGPHGKKRRHGKHIGNEPFAGKPCRKGNQVLFRDSHIKGPVRKGFPKAFVPAGSCQVRIDEDHPAVFPAQGGHIVPDHIPEEAFGFFHTAHFLS